MRRLSPGSAADQEYMGMALLLLTPPTHLLGSVGVARTAPVVAAASSMSPPARRWERPSAGVVDADTALAAVNAVQAEPQVADLGMLSGDPVAVQAAAGADRDLAGALTGMIAEGVEQERDSAALAKLKRRHHLDEVAAVDVEQRLAGLPAKTASWTSGIGARSARDLLPAAEEQLVSAQRILEVARSVPVLRRRARKGSGRGDNRHRSASGCGRPAAAVGGRTDGRHGRGAGHQVGPRRVMPGLWLTRTPVCGGVREVDHHPGPDSCRRSIGAGGRCRPRFCPVPGSAYC